MSTASDIFTGSFDFIPVRASLELPPVPSSPSMRDFDDAQTYAINADPWTNRGVAEIWRAEAVRWRRCNPDMPLDLPAIARATAAVVFRRQRDDLAS
jgi:hypothetical protein